MPPDHNPLQKLALLAQRMRQHPVAVRTMTSKGFSYEHTDIEQWIAHWAMFSVQMRVEVMHSANSIWKELTHVDRHI